MLLPIIISAQSAAIGGAIMNSWIASIQGAATVVMGARMVSSSIGVLWWLLQRALYVGPSSHL